MLRRKEAALNWINSINANGGTELLPVLNEIYSKADKRKNTVIILLSDGDVENTADVFKLVKANADVSIFSVGIGDNVSHDLIEGLANHSGGQARFIKNKDTNIDIISTVQNLLKLSQDTLRKHQNDYKVEMFTVSGRTRNVPSVLPPLYEGIDNTLYIFSESEPDTIIFTTYQGEYANNRTMNVKEITPIKLDASNESTMHRIAGIKLINELLAQEQSEVNTPKGSRMNDMRVDINDKSCLKQEIIDVSTDLNILSPYTAFIGVEELANKITGNMELRDIPLQEPKNENKSKNKSASIHKSMNKSRSSSNYSNAKCIDSDQYESYSNKSDKYSTLKSLTRQTSQSSYSQDKKLNKSKSKSVSPSANNNKKSMSKSKIKPTSSRYVSDSDSDDSSESDDSTKAASTDSTESSESIELSKPNNNNVNNVNEDVVSTSTFIDDIREYFSGISNYFTSVSTNNNNNNNNVIIKQESSDKTGCQFKPKPNVVLIVDRALKGLLVNGKLKSANNESLKDLLIKLFGPNMLSEINKLKKDDFIQLVGEEYASHNGYYKIVNLGSATEQWILESV